jgi:hypothetical protein
MPHRVKEFVSSGKGERLYILEQDDGFYRFISEVYHEAGDRTPEYWAPVIYSGLYDSLENAERDAVLSVPWLSAVFHHKTGDSE